MKKLLYTVPFMLLTGACALQQPMEIVTPPGERPVPICSGVGSYKSAMDPDVVTFTSRGPYNDRSVTRKIYLVQGRYSERQLFAPRGDGRWQRQVRPQCQFTIWHGTSDLTRRVARHVSRLLVGERYTVWIVDTKGGNIVGQHRRAFRVSDRIRGDRIRLTYSEQLVHQRVRLPTARVPRLVEPTISGTICIGRNC